MSNVRARKISDLVEAGVSHIGHSGTGLCRDLFDPLLERGMATWTTRRARCGHVPESVSAGNVYSIGSLLGLEMSAFISRDIGLPMT